MLGGMDRDGELRSIGRMARECGLTVSALRFYDGAGVLVPSRVDPGTGYRWYRAEQVGHARLLAALRRVGMPLADVSRVLEHRADRPLVERLLSDHLRALEDGLADARRQLDVARSLLDPPETLVTASSVLTTGTALAGAFAAVRYAVSADPELPMLGGVLLELDADGARVVASDRYRLAVAALEGAEVSGPAVRALLPIGWVDEVVGRLGSRPGPVTVHVAGGAVSAAGIEATLLEDAFPDYRRLLRSDSAHRIPLRVGAFREQLVAAPTRRVRGAEDGVEREVTVLTLDEDGTLDVAASGPGALQLGVNREFLLEALDAGGAGQLVLGLDGPIAPLALSDPARVGTVSLLMPVRLG